MDTNLKKRTFQSNQISKQFLSKSSSKPSNPTTAVTPPPQAQTPSSSKLKTNLSGKAEQKVASDNHSNNATNVASPVWKTIDANSNVPTPASHKSIFGAPSASSQISLHGSSRVLTDDELRKSGISMVQSAPGPGNTPKSGGMSKLSWAEMDPEEDEKILNDTISWTKPSAVSERPAAVAITENTKLNSADISKTARSDSGAEKWDSTTKHAGTHEQSPKTVASPPAKQEEEHTGVNDTKLGTSISTDNKPAPVVSPPATRQVASDDFVRRSDPERTQRLFNSQSGQYEPVHNDARRMQNDFSTGPSTVLQRTSKPVASDMESRWSSFDQPKLNSINRLPAPHSSAAKDNIWGSSAGNRGSLGNGVFNVKPNAPPTMADSARGANNRRSPGPHQKQTGETTVSRGTAATFVKLEVEREKASAEAEKHSTARAPGDDRPAWMKSNGMASIKTPSYKEPTPYCEWTPAAAESKRDTTNSTRDEAKPKVIQKPPVDTAASRGPAAAFAKTEADREKAKMEAEERTAARAPSDNRAAWMVANGAASSKAAPYKEPTSYSEWKSTDADPKQVDTTSSRDRTTVKTVQTPPRDTVASRGAPATYAKVETEREKAKMEAEELAPARAPGNDRPAWMVANGAAPIKMPPYKAPASWQKRDSASTIEPGRSNAIVNSSRDFNHISRSAHPPASAPAAIAAPVSTPSILNTPISAGPPISGPPSAMNSPEKLSGTEASQHTGQHGAAVEKHALPPSTLVHADANERPKKTHASEVAPIQHQATNKSPSKPFEASRVIGFDGPSKIVGSVPQPVDGRIPIHPPIGSSLPSAAVRTSSRFFGTSQDRSSATQISLVAQKTQPSVQSQVAAQEAPCPPPMDPSHPAVGGLSVPRVRLPLPGPPRPTVRLPPSNQPPQLLNPARQLHDGHTALQHDAHPVGTRSSVPPISYKPSWQDKIDRLLNNIKSDQKALNGELPTKENRALHEPMIAMVKPTAQDLEFWPNEGGEPYGSTACYSNSLPFPFDVDMNIVVSLPGKNDKTRIFEMLSRTKPDEVELLDERSLGDRPRVHLPFVPHDRKITSRALRRGGFPQEAHWSFCATTGPFEINGQIRRAVVRFDTFISPRQPNAMKSLTSGPIAAKSGNDSFDNRFGRPVRFEQHQRPNSKYDWSRPARRAT